MARSARIFFEKTHKHEKFVKCCKVFVLEAQSSLLNERHVFIKANKNFVKNCNFLPKIVFVFLTSAWMKKFNNAKNIDRKRAIKALRSHFFKQYRRHLLFDDYYFFKNAWFFKVKNGLWNICGQQCSRIFVCNKIFLSFKYTRIWNYCKCYLIQNVKFYMQVKMSCN